jgi:hypothetical protein
VKIRYEILFVSKNTNIINNFKHGIGAKLWDYITQNLYFSTACPDHSPIFLKILKMLKLPVGKIR